jgi:precorrin-2 dehydrogenase / sirohydrochlorin ferrochelatase
MTTNEIFSPVGMRLQGRKIVFAGGGAVAERKLLRFVDSGATVTVVSPDASGEIEALASAGKIALERRPAAAADFAEAFLVFIATNDAAANAELAAAARGHGALVNRADDPDDCDFVLPALAYMNTLHLGVFSGSPALSKWVRQYLEQTLGPEFPEFAACFGEIRSRIRKLDLPQPVRAEILTKLLNQGLYQTYKTSGMKAVNARTDEVLAAYTDKPAG